MTKNEFILSTAKEIYCKYDLKTNSPIIVAKKSLDYANILARECKELFSDYIPEDVPDVSEIPDNTEDVPDNPDVPGNSEDNSGDNPDIPEDNPDIESENDSTDESIY